MRDYQELIDLLQTVVATPGQWDQGELAELAEEYAEQCRALNKRIGECFKLLREGQTAEAVRLAEFEPRLIEWGGTLDFPERERWVSLCELLGIPSPPALMHDRLKAVHEAYSVSPTLETLTRLWRYQNLTRAAISERLDTLRRLAAADETNLTWHDDIRAFEEAWLKEIRQEVAAAVKQEDRDQLLRLRAQIESATWTVQVPREVVEEIDRTAAALERNRMTLRLEQVAEQLDAAYAAGDDEAAGEALQEFDTLCAALKLERDDPRWIAAEPAREWWTQRRQEAEQRRRAAAAEASLERELDRPGALEQIVKLHDAATAGGRSLPIELERHYRLVVERLTAERHRAHQLRMATAGVVALALLVVVFAAAWLIMRRQDQTEIARSVDEFIAKNQLQAADEFVARLKEDRPAVLQSAVVQAAMARLKDAHGKEEGRLREFKTLVGRIEERLATPEGSPSKEDVRQLTELARSDEEKLEAQRVAGRAEERWRDRDRLAREHWKERFIDVSEKIGRLESVDISLVTAEDLGEADAALRELRQDTAVPESLTASATPLQARLTAIKSRREKFEQDLQRVQPLIRAMELRGAFEATLREIARDEKNRFAADCAKTADALPWDAVDAWNTLAELWNSRRQDLDPNSAARLIAAVNKTGYPAGGNDEWNEFLRSRWLPYLEAVARRDEAALQAILKPWEAAIVKQTYRYCELADGRETILYSLEDSRGKLSAKMVGISALMTDDPFDGTPTPEAKTVSGPAVIFADVSPQRRLCAESDESLRALCASPGNLEKLACDLLVDMIRNQEKAKEDWASAARSPRDSSPSVRLPMRVPVNDYIFARLFADTVMSVSALSPIFAEHWQPAVKELRDKLPRCQKDWMQYEPRWVSDSNAAGPTIPLRIPSVRDAEAMAAATLQSLGEVRRPLPLLRWVGFVYYVDESSPAPRFHGLKDAFRPNTTLVGVPSPSSSASDVRGIRVIARVDERQSLQWQYPTVPFGTPLFEFGDASVPSGKQ